MRVIVRHEDFSAKEYNLEFGEGTLNFTGEPESFVLPVWEISDFCITDDNKGKLYFTMITDGKMYNGQIIDVTEIRPFMTALREKLDGVIHIDVKRN